MSYFTRLPSQMNNKHYTNLNIGLINCMVHILQFGAITEDDRERFINVLREVNFSEYWFVNQAINYLKKINTTDGPTRQNLISLAAMLVGSSLSPIDGRLLLSSLYHENIILDYLSIFKNACNSSTPLFSNEEFVNEIKEKLATAQSWANIRS